MDEMEVGTKFLDLGLRSQSQQDSLGLLGLAVAGENS